MPAGARRRVPRIRKKACVAKRDHVKNSSPFLIFPAKHFHRGKHDFILTKNMTRSTRFVCRTRAGFFLIAAGLAAFAPSRAGRAQSATSSAAKPWVSTWGSAMSGPANGPVLRLDFLPRHRRVQQSGRPAGRPRQRGRQPGTHPALQRVRHRAAARQRGAHRAHRRHAASTIPGTDRTLTFNGGSPYVLIPTGAPESQRPGGPGPCPRARLLSISLLPARRHHGDHRARRTRRTTPTSRPRTAAT